MPRSVSGATLQSLSPLARGAGGHPDKLDAMQIRCLRLVTSASHV